MEREIFTPYELTGEAQSAYSNNGVKFMPEANGNPEGGQPGQPETVSDIQTQILKAREELTSLHIPSAPQEQQSIIPKIHDLVEKAGVLGQATWSDKGNDRPVIVTGFYAKGSDGRVYLKTDLIPGGIPMDEVTFPPLDVPSPDRLEELRREDLDAKSRKLEDHYQRSEKHSEEIVAGVNQEYVPGAEEIARENIRAEQIKINALRAERDRLERMSSAAGGSGNKPPEQPPVDQGPKNSDPEPPDRNVLATERLAAAMEKSNELAHRQREQQSQREQDSAKTKDKSQFRGQGFNGDSEVLEGYKDLLGKISRVKEIEEKPENERTDEEKILLNNKEDLRTEQKNVLRQYASTIPVSTAYVSREDIELISDDSESINFILNQLLTRPLDAETSEYRLSLIEEQNVSSIMAFLKRESVESGEMKDEYERAIAFQSGISLVHGMSVLINTGNLQEFAGRARQILPQHLQILQEAKGAGMVMRLFDDEFRMALAKDGAINNDNYFKLMGLRKSLSKNSTREEGIILGRVKEQIASLKAQGSPEFVDMQDWEVIWAYNAAKIMYSITLRAAEMISLSENAPGDKKFASFPQESMARVMNWMGQLGLRFEIAEIRGGYKLAKMSQHNFQEQREEDGYEKTNLKKIGGKKMEDFELPSMFGVSGLWSGWRQGLIVLGQIPWEANGKQTNLKDYFVSLGKKVEDPKTLLSVFLDGNGELRNEFNSSLGMLLTQGLITPGHGDSKHKGLREAKAQVREAIWEKVAKDNPLAMSSFLHGMEYSNGTKVDILNDPSWNSLHSKLFYFHEVRMGRLRNSNGSTTNYISLNDLINSKEGGTVQELTPEEQTLLSRIQKEGVSAAKEFTNIRFPFTPFINDTLFENADFSDAGAEVYRRRIASDIPAFSGAYEAFSKLMSNPGGIEPKEALKILHEMAEAIGAPLSTEGGQNKVFPFATAYFRFIEKGGVSENSRVRFMRKFSIVSGPLHLLKKPNSLAQEYAGLEAPSVNEREIMDLAHAGVHMGLFNHHEHFKKIKKKFGAGFFRLLFKDILEIAPIILVAGGAELFSQTSKDAGKDI